MGVLLDELRGREAELDRMRQLYAFERAKARRL